MMTSAKEPAPSERENVLQPNRVSISSPPVAPVALAEGQLKQHPLDGPHDAGNISLRVSERGDKPLAGAELAFTAKIIERPVAASVQPEAPPVSKPIDAGISAPPPGAVARLGERFSPDAAGPDTPDAAEPLQVPDKAPTRTENQALPLASDAHRPSRANEGRVPALGSRNTEAPVPPTHAASVVRETGFVTTPRARPDVATNMRPSPTESGPVMLPDATTARQISMRVAESGRENVEVRLAERAGELHVAVRARDAELARSLGDRLSELVLRLEQKGFEAEAWRPLGAGFPVLAEPREARTLESGLQRGPAGESNSGWTQDGGGDRQQHNRGRHEWIEALEANLPSGGDSPTQRGVNFDGSIR